MKKLLVTGSEGFIGKNIVEKLSNCYDISAPTEKELDLLDTDSLRNYLSIHHFDIVLHAALFGNNQSTDDGLFIKCNLKMFYNLKSCNHLYERMYYFGSGAEYDSRYYKPFMEEEYFGTYIPEDSYGLYKYVLAQECMKEENIYDLRLFGVFGKYELWQRRFISNNICRALAGLPMTLSQNMYFDYIYIDDLCEILRWFIENEPKHHHYNVCRGEHIDLKSLGEIIRGRLKIDCDLIVAKEGFKPEYSGNNDRLLNEIGNYSFVSFEESIDRLIDYYSTIIDVIRDKLEP